MGGFKAVATCKRCGLTTTYTNGVEYALWQDRPGCPACFKRRDDSDDLDETPAENLSIAELAKWYFNETTALQQLLDARVLTNDEAMAMRWSVRRDARVALGLEAIGADEQ